MASTLYETGVTETFYQLVVTEIKFQLENDSLKT